MFGGSPHLEGYPAERLSVRGDVEENRGVLVGPRRPAAVHAGGGEGQRTQLDPVRQKQHDADSNFWLGREYGLVVPLYPVTASRRPVTPLHVRDEEVFPVVSGSTTSPGCRESRDTKREFEH